MVKKKSIIGRRPAILDMKPKVKIVGNILTKFGDKWKVKKHK